MQRKATCKTITLVYLLLAGLLSFCQPPYQPAENTFRIMFYNVENLFDPYDDPEKNDNDFTPEGNYRWTEYRWKEKTAKISKVIRAVGQGSLPAIIGFCEIENRLVLEELAKHPIIRDGNYRIVHYESPDRRGIDVGLFYRDEFFYLLYSEPILVQIPENPNFKTRDILYVKGMLANADTLHLFVNHWPSRLGGAATSEPNRIAAASILKAKTDSIFAFHADANILIMGDFNDEPKDRSLLEILQAKTPDSNSKLINLMLLMPEGIGSHKFQGKWSFLDQIIVSQALYKGIGKLKIHNREAKVFKEEFLLEDDKRYPGKMPFRQFIGFRYNGGFSDHLPVYVDLSIKN